MTKKLVHFLLLAALVAVSSLALADPPTLVGRISAAEGAVTVRTDEGEETGSLLNWPVKHGDRLTTARGARAEFRVGPVAVRLDGDSALDIEELDEDVMRLRLNYGSANVRVRDAQALAGFELATPQGRVRLTEPGVVRIDTELEPETMTVSVLLGTARVEAAGTVLNLRAGKRADIRGDDVDTALARQDAFDAWAAARDRRADTAVATRYIPSYVTGYEDLDHYGSWTVNDEYGPLWAPRGVARDWAPYRDGRWAWVAPWGWTWVDNAPWGYAPFHYGRWVVVNRRWCWAPGRIVGRPVWAPALVGWVGGSGWSVSFSDRFRGPGLGWYPLTPRDRYVPHYDVSPDHERRLGWHFRGNERWKAVPARREGITVVPREHFEQRRLVRVDNAPRVTAVPNAGSLPLATPVVPRAFERSRDGLTSRNPVDRNRDGIADRVQVDRNRDGTPDRLQTDRNRDGIADRMQVDRNRDGTPDRLQTDRNRDGIADRMQIDRNRDGTPDRLQTDRNGDGTPDRLQIDRNRDGIPDRQQVERRDGLRLQTDEHRFGIADRLETERNHDGVADRLRIDRNRERAERARVDANRPAERNPGVIVTDRQPDRPRNERPAPTAPQPAQPQFTPPQFTQPQFTQPQVSQPQPRPVRESSPEGPSRPFATERMEHMREMREERAEARRQAQQAQMQAQAHAQAQAQAQRPPVQMAPAAPVVTAPVVQPRPAPPPPAPVAQPNPPQPQQGGHERPRPTGRGENMRER